VPVAGERVVRRLAAILAADVAGYSRLMGRDETGTLARLKTHRTQRIEPALARHGGRLVKLSGDGVLVEFASAVDALSAAIEIQQAMADANREHDEDKAIVFRIGLHLGDLIVDGDDLYGDGVNVAARLEAAALAGGILISRNVHDAVSGKLNATFEDVGGLALKNIERPHQAFKVRWEPADWQVSAGTALSPLHAVTASSMDTPLALPDKPSIAVLPFQNMSGDPEQEYFTDGLVEDIITALSRFRSLFVIARNSSFTYKGRTVDIKQVGRQLGVRYVLEGSVRKAGSRVRITGQLIDSMAGTHIWADRYDGDSADVFDLQDRVTLDVVGAIIPKLEQAEIERAIRKPTGSPGAYDCYLRGIACYHPRTVDGMKMAQRFCHQAIDLDPSFAAAHAMIALCHGVLVGLGVKPSQDAVVETSRFAQRAVELDRDDAIVLGMAAWGQANVIRDLDAAEGLVERALVINPNLAMAWTMSGWVNTWLGKPVLALEHFSRATRLSPLDPNLRFTLGGAAHAHFMAGQYDQAMSLVGKAMQNGRNAPLCSIAAAGMALAGQPVEARKFVDELLKLDPSRRVSNLAEVLGPYRRPDDVERYKEGLRLAGLPE
jgi:TolB-like protein/class 3 adenylate cyclase